MKKKLKNITSASGKKNKADIVICAIIFTLSMGIMAGCFIAKDNTEDIHGQFRAETKDILLENTQVDELLLEADSNLPETEQVSPGYFISIGNLTMALYEDKQDITDKLNENVPLRNYIFDSCSSSAVLDKLKKVITEKTISAIIEVYPSLTYEQLKFPSTFLIAGIADTYAEWTHSDKSVTLDELIKILSKLTCNALDFISAIVK